MIKKVSLLFSVALIVSMGCDTGQQVSQQSVESTPASTSSEHAAVEFTSAAFEADVLNNSKVVLVDCWAPW